MERPTCKTCPYWQGNIRGSRGYCRRSRPVARVENFGDDTVLVGEHPLTWPDAWCGDHPHFERFIQIERLHLPAKKSVPDGQ